MMTINVNGIHLVNPDDPDYQLSHQLYEAQLLYSQVESGETIDPERVKEVCRRLCRAITLLGALRGDYSTLIRITEVFGVPVVRETETVRVEMPQSMMPPVPSAQAETHVADLIGRQNLAMYRKIGYFKMLAKAIIVIGSLTAAYAFVQYLLQV